VEHFYRTRPIWEQKFEMRVPKELHRPASEIPDPFQICSQYLMRTHGCVSVGVITVFVSPLTELFAAAAAAGQHHY